MILNNFKILTSIFNIVTDDSVDHSVLHDVVFKECHSTLKKIYSRLTTNGLAFARTALSKTNS